MAEPRPVLSMHCQCGHIVLFYGTRDISIFGGGSLYRIGNIDGHIEFWSTNPWKCPKCAGLENIMEKTEDDAKP